MEDYQLRMVDEQESLNDKINKLMKFINHNPIFNTLPKDERDDMKRQLKGMRIYNDSLVSRINRFKSKS